jgi:hypothetical protein
MCRFVPKGEYEVVVYMKISRMSATHAEISTVYDETASFFSLMLFGLLAMSTLLRTRSGSATSPGTAFPRTRTPS